LPTTETAFQRTTVIFDAMRDEAVERLRFKQSPAGMKILAARREADWAEASSLLPGSRQDIEDIEALVVLGGHERLDLVYRDEVGLRFICAVHSSREGPGAGGLRRHELSDLEIDVLLDALNLARAMTYKNKAAGLARGGSKICVHNPDIPGYARDAWMTCLAEEIDISGTITGPDSGYDSSVYRELAALTTNVSGVLAGGTSRSAATGVLAAIQATAAALGQPLKETSVAIQGLGHLGTYLAEDLSGEGAKLIVTAQDHRRTDAFLGSLTPDARKRVGSQRTEDLVGSTHVDSLARVGSQRTEECIDATVVLVGDDELGALS